MDLLILRTIGLKVSGFDVLHPAWGLHGVGLALSLGFPSSTELEFPDSAVAVKPVL